MSPGDADLAWGRTGMHRVAAQCVRSGQSPGWTPALGDWGQGTLPAAEGHRATTTTGPGHTSKGKMIHRIERFFYCDCWSNSGYSETVKVPMNSLLSFHKESLMCNWGNANGCSTPFIPSGSDFPWSTAGGSGGHRGARPAGDGNDESEELSHPVPPRLCHAGPSASRCYSVTGQLSF